MVPRYGVKTMIVNGIWIPYGKPFYSVGKTPIERAHDAQREFAGTINVPPKSEKGIEAALLSVLSTAAIAVWDDRGIGEKVRKHKGFDKLEPKAWSLLRREVLDAVRSGLSAFVIVDRLLRPKMHNIFGEDLLLPTQELGQWAVAHRAGE